MLCCVRACVRAGKYLVQYLWSGYYDIMDINVLDVPIAQDVWGSAGGSTGYDRTDHCEFIPSYTGFSILDCMAINNNDDVSTCAGMCTGGCDGIQVVQKALDPRVVAAGVYTSPSEHIPTQCNGAVANDPGAPMVCFALSQGTPQVGPAYYISSDPEDPVFYNSCFRKAR